MVGPSVDHECAVRQQGDRTPAGVRQVRRDGAHLSLSNGTASPRAPTPLRRESSLPVFDVTRISLSESGCMMSQYYPLSIGL